MRTAAIFALMFVSLAATPYRVESQGLGGLIKKKAAEAAKGKDAKPAPAKTAAKDDGPTVRSAAGRTGARSHWASSSPRCLETVQKLFTLLEASC
jgi:hypothetical protein